ncbi:MAG: hypothetical protein ABWW69_02075 [Pyrodictiaceae archaeon]
MNSARKGPLKVSVVVDGDEFTVEADYRFTARLNINGLVLDFSFKPQDLEIDVRGLAVSEESLRVALRGLKALASIGEEVSTAYTLRLKMYGITLRILAGASP